MIGLPDTLTRPVRVSSGHRSAGQFGLRVARGAAQQRTHAGQHFLKMKWLGDIIVGPGVEALNLVAPTIPRGEDQYRHRTPVTAPGFQHRNAVHLRQADVEHDSVIGFAVAEKMPFFTIEGAINDITGVGQRGGQLTIEVRIIFNDKQAQGDLQM